MACKSKAACACRSCGPFVINSQGAFTSLDGAPLDLDGSLGTSRQERQFDERGFAIDQGGSGVARSWHPQPSRPTSDFDVPLGAGANDFTSSPHPGPIGSGGNGQIPTPSATVDPIGARPSVPARIGSNFAAVSRPGEAYREPYGLLPLQLTEQAVYGSQGAPFDNAGLVDPSSALPSTPIQPTRQYLAPLPASQAVCIVNGFDPSWGQPPATYQGVVMQFDPTLGAYRFSPAAMHPVFVAQEEPALMEWFHRVAPRYEQGQMLQPYKPNDGSGWSFRWIPRRQEVVC